MNTLCGCFWHFLTLRYLWGLLFLQSRKVTDMGRPQGMKKINGIWYMPDGSIAPSSRDKVTDDVVIPTVKVTATEPPQRYTGYVMYDRQDIKQVEVKTNLTYRGDISDDHGLRIPVFFNADRSEDWCVSHLTKMRKGDLA